MPGRIGPLPYRKVKRALLRLGFRIDRQVGSHVIFVHSDGRLLSVPHHAREAAEL
ncbi:MAG: type II toxin-antitoxin system HicA family toxin [Candidatus Thermoplasmatota archaeon]